MASTNATMGGIYKLNKNGDKNMMQETITPNKRAYSVKEVAQETSLSPSFVRLEIKRGKLKARKFGTRTLITDENLSNYLNGENENEK